MMSSSLVPCGNFMAMSRALFRYVWCWPKIGRFQNRVSIHDYCVASVFINPESVISFPIRFAFMFVRI
ncbi:MAG: hypothetical protein NC113_02375, partial [Bacteroides sp.]|nr:hypothetical protein [Bacteroides sp.]